MLTATRGPYVLVIQPDDDPFNPREDDNFGKMVCFHRRYHLGDHHNYIDKDDFLRDLYLKTVGDDERGAHRYERALDLMNYKIKAPFGSPAYEREVDERLMKVISQKFLMLPLYLYDHSGITMNTTGFSCPWDSGQVGWIYASKEDALREFGGKTFTAATRKKAEDRMRGEVEYICLRPFRRMNRTREFRLFIRDGQLNAMSQYYLLRHFRRLEGVREKYWERAGEFVEHISWMLPLKTLVMDIYFTAGGEIMIVDLNPWGGATDPLLLRSWDRDWSKPAGIVLMDPPTRISGDVSVSF